MGIKYQGAVLFVEDIQKSRRFYEEVLGQTVVMDHGPNVAFEGEWALWQADHAFQMVYGQERTEETPMGRQNLELYFETETLDTVRDKLHGAGVPFVHDLREQPWGQRVMRIHDPDGHVVEIGEPMPVVVLRFLQQGLTVAEVAARTSMPVDIVKQLNDLAV